jgi:hypothetical protein
MIAWEALVIDRVCTLRVSIGTASPLSVLIARRKPVDNKEAAASNRVGICIGAGIGDAVLVAPPTKPVVVGHIGPILCAVSRGFVGRRRHTRSAVRARGCGT